MCVVIAFSACYNDIICIVSIHHRCPETVRGHVRVFKIFARSSKESLSSITGVTSNDVTVVAMELGEGLFNKGSPKRTIMGDLVKNSAWHVRLRGVVPLLPYWQVVVNDHSVGNTKGVHVDTIDTSLIEGLILVKEHFFNATWYFCIG